MSLKIKLKAHDKIIVNGAVIATGDKPAEILFLNQARILRQDDILLDSQIRDAMSEGNYLNDSWLYYLIQLIYIDPENAGNLQQQLTDTVTLLRNEYPEKNQAINEILSLMADGQLFRALKACKKAFPNCLAPKTGAKKEDAKMNVPMQKMNEPMQTQTQSYSQTPPVSDPRAVEAWALMKSADRLESARREKDDVELRESLRINQILWTIIQTAAAEQETELPPEVRDNILNLSLIVDRKTFDCLGDLDRDKLPFLIDLNRNIAMGLMGMPGDGDDGAPAVAGTNAD